MVERSIKNTNLGPARLNEKPFGQALARSDRLSIGCRQGNVANAARYSPPTPLHGSPICEAILAAPFPEAAGLSPEHFNRVREQYAEKHYGLAATLGTRRLEPPSVARFHIAARNARSAQSVSASSVERLTMSGASKKTMPLVGARERADAKALEVVLAALNDVTVADLRKEWVRLFRSHPPKKLGRDLLTLGVAWKLQEREFGGLTAANRRQLDALTTSMESKADLAKSRKVTLRPGARLIREWNGEINEVLVVEDGFQWRGKTWRSLSVIARELTGTHWSGPRFFGLNAGRRNG